METKKIKFENQVYHLSDFFKILSKDEFIIEYSIDFKKESKEEWQGLILRKTSHGWIEVRYDNTKGYPDRFIQSIGNVIDISEKKNTN